MNTLSRITLGLITAVVLAPATTFASNTLRVTLTLASPDGGEAGCALYSDEAGFPSDGEKARTRQWHPAAATVVCEFTDLPDGLYAVGSSHDLNGNRVVDTNLVGMPKEAWGVSRNARPRFRAPRFDEAAVALEGGGTTELAIEVRR
jgi:uncharacterized protein (DUF2141 family)